MKKLTIAAVVMSVLLCGCTAPSNRIADNAMTTGLTQTDNIMLDLTTQAKYYLVAYEVERINNPNKSETNAEIIQRVANNISKIEWLNNEYTKSRELLRHGQRYIWEQRGIIDMIFEDAEESMAVTEKVTNQ